MPPRSTVLMVPGSAGPAAPPLEPPWQLLREAYFLLRRQWTEHLDRFGLSLSDYFVLELCSQTPAKASEVARSIGITAAGGTDLIDRLEGRRLVRRVADEADRRVVLIRLTPAGLRQYKDARAAKSASLRDLSVVMTLAEREALTRGLSALIRSLRQDALAA